MPSIYDVAIIGGGPAGLTAGIWLARYLHSVVLIDSGDPRHWETRGVNGFLGMPHARPADLRAAGRDECRKYGVELIDGFVAKVVKDGDDAFCVEYDPMPVTKAVLDGEGSGAPRAPDDNEPRDCTVDLQARRVLLAFGLKDEWPRVPGLRQVYGSTAHVCPDCDGYETRGMRVAVIGSGRKAVGLALNLATWTSDIVICTNGEEAGLEPEYQSKLDALGIAVVTDHLTGIDADDASIRALLLENGGRIPCDKVFFKLSQRPADDLGAQLGCERDDEGQIVTDGHGHTSVYNVFAAGDIAPGPQLAIAAAAEGAIAALAIHKSLVPAERKLAKREPATAEP
jgi:thioredoxin reductase